MQSWEPDTTAGCKEGGMRVLGSRFGPLVVAFSVVATATAPTARSALFFLFSPTNAHPGEKVVVRTGGTPAGLQAWRPGQGQSAADPAAPRGDRRVSVCLADRCGMGGCDLRGRDRRGDLPRAAAFARPTPDANARPAFVRYLRDPRHERALDLETSPQR